MRKVLGALKRQLVEQFFGEALITTGVAFLIAVFIINLAIPAFNQLTGKSFEFSEIFKPEIILALIVIILLIGFVAGAYPALYLSRLRPGSALKGAKRQVSNLVVQKVLIVIQFMVSAFFLTGMVMVLMQVGYLQNKDLGYDKDHVIVLDGDRFPQMRDALREVTGVEHVAGVPLVLGGQLPRNYYRAENSRDTTHQMIGYGTTPGLIETMSMQLVAGRSFREKTPSDQYAFILNESAVRELNLQQPEEAIGKSFEMLVPALEGGPEVWRKGKIVGVVKDFNHDALYKKTEPLALYLSFDLTSHSSRSGNLIPTVLPASKKHGM